MKKVKAGVVIMAEKYGNLLPRCVMCGEVPRAGISSGIVVKKRFICSECEKNLVINQLTVGDYKHLVEEFR